MHIYFLKVKKKAPVLRMELAGLDIYVSEPNHSGLIVQSEYKT